MKLPGIALMAIGLLTPPAFADVCVSKPLKVTRVCGVVVDPSGEPIANARLSVLKNGMPLSSSSSDSEGRFDFAVTESGQYELELAARGFVPANYHLTLQHASKSCSTGLRIQIALPSIHCGEGDIKKIKMPPATHQ